MPGKFWKVPLLAAFVLLLLPGGWLAASDEGQPTVAPSPYQNPDNPVTSYFTSATNVSSLDPARAEDSLSINWIENLFLGLTNNNPLNNYEIQPELATSWETPDARVWTFNLRTDVPWVRYNPQTGETERLRNVVAGDFVYGIKRACDPRLGSRYSSIISGVIEGCDRIKQRGPDHAHRCNYFWRHRERGGPG
ncbi:MAG: hypothetical protein HC915_13945 [Anaerolineae bacterium]|nr:hypothetical protein [Anaerolineae bacterium]